MDWVAQTARQGNRFVEDWWSGNLDADPDPERMARVCPLAPNGTDPYGYYLLEDTPARRWSIRFTIDGRTTVCRSSTPAGPSGAVPPTPPPWRRTQDRMLGHAQGVHSGFENVRIALREGEPVVVWREISLARHSNELVRNRCCSTLTQDWEALTERVQWFGNDSRLAAEASWAIVPALAGTASLPVTYNVTVGTRLLSVPRLEVGARREGPNVVVAIETQPVAVAGDRVEIWFGAEDDLFGAGSPVAMRLDRGPGRWAVARLAPPGWPGAVPVVSEREGRLELTLSGSFLGGVLDGDGSAGFTVVFERAEGRTRVATSPLDPVHPVGTLGRLVSTDGRRYARVVGGNADFEVNRLP